MSVPELIGFPLMCHAGDIINTAVWSQFGLRCVESLPLPGSLPRPSYLSSVITSASLFIARSAAVANGSLSRSFFHMFIYINDVKINPLLKEDLLPVKRGHTFFFFPLVQKQT